MNKDNLKSLSKTDWKRIDSMKDEEIDYSDIPELNEDFFKNAQLKMPEKKTLVTMRLDKEVLDWFKSKGRGYQTRINELLRAYMKAHQHQSQRKHS